MRETGQRGRERETGHRETGQRDREEKENWNENRNENG